MNKQPTNSKERALCYLCFGSYARSRIGTHVKRCSCRLDDVALIAGRHENPPKAFILMAVLAHAPEYWLCVEAHVTAQLLDLANFFHDMWLPLPFIDEGGFAISDKRLPKPGPEPQDRTMDVRLETLLGVKDDFFYLPTSSENPVIHIKVLSKVDTCFLHRPVDVLARPLQPPQEAKAAQVM